VNAATLFTLGWRWGGRLPDWLRRTLAAGAADATWLRRGAGVRRLEKNLARVRPDATRRQLRALSRRGMRSYLRYFAEIFAMPALSEAQIDARVRAVGHELVVSEIAAGRSAILALGHLGNWDLAGAWAHRHLGPVTTVAERLEPERLFEAFTRFRSGFGMATIPLSGSGADVFRRLVRVARTDARVIPLIADRDLTATGVEVDLFGERARVAAGPAALAVTTGRVLIPVVVYYERLTGVRRRAARTPWGVVLYFAERVVVPTDVPSADLVPQVTQAWVTRFEAQVRAHAEDWHMLQRVFVSDLDPARDAAIRSADGAAT